MVKLIFFLYSYIIFTDHSRIQSEYKWARSDLLEKVINTKSLSATKTRTSFTCVEGWIYWVTLSNDYTPFEIVSMGHMLYKSQILK